MVYLKIPTGKNAHEDTTYIHIHIHTCRAVPELIMREEGAIVAGVGEAIVFLAKLRPVLHTSGQAI